MYVIKNKATLTGELRPTHKSKTQDNGINWLHADENLTSGIFLSLNLFVCVWARARFLLVYFFLTDYYLFQTKNTVLVQIGKSTDFFPIVLTFE